MSNLINFELLEAQIRVSQEDEKIIRADERKKTIDEFAEKIREYSESYFIDCDPYWGTVETAFKTDIFLDDIVEEMKGETE